MQIKEQVFALLEKNAGRCISGAQMAKELGVSRNAVWKAVQALKQEGAAVDGVTNKGYCLAAGADCLSARAVQERLADNAARCRVEVYKTLPSTNTFLKEKAESGAEEGLVILAQEQTSGKGRLGRSFFSPPLSGLYMSLLLRPQMRAQESLYITTAAAVAVAQAIEEVSGQKAQIKWVNDVYCQGKKVCGILTEAAMDLESGTLRYAVLGIGVNVRIPEGGFGAELKDIATALYPHDAPASASRNLLAAAILNHFFSFYGHLQDKAFMDDYRARSFLQGKQIVYQRGGELLEAVVEGIDEQARLLIRQKDGTRTALYAGEVSVRRMKDE